MKKICLFLVILVGANLPSASAETVNLSTYYPAPFGVYDRLRLVPKPSSPDFDPGTCTAAQIGTLAVETPDILRFCGTTGWGFVPGVWTQNNIDAANATLFPSDTVRAIRLGIGTTAPTQRLDVEDGWSLLNSQASTVNRNFGVGLWSDLRFGMELGFDGVWATRIFTRNAGEAITFGNSAGGAFQTHFTEWARLSNGNLGLGTTTLTDRLNVNGDLRLLPGTSYRQIHWGETGVPRLESRSGEQAFYFSSDHDTVTRLRMRDRQLVTYGSLYGSGNGRYFGLLDGTGHWFMLYDDNPAQQNVQLRSGTADTVRLRAYSSATGGGRIDIRSGGPGAPLDDLRVRHVAAAPSGYYAVYAP